MSGLRAPRNVIRPGAIMHLCPVVMVLKAMRSIVLPRVAALLQFSSWPGFVPAIHVFLV